MAGKEQGPQGVEIGQVIHDIHEVTPGAGFDKLRVRKGKAGGDVEPQVVLNTEWSDLRKENEVVVRRGKNTGWYGPDGEHRGGYESKGYTEVESTAARPPPMPRNSAKNST